MPKALTLIRDSRKEPPSPTAEAATGGFQQCRYAKKRFLLLTTSKTCGADQRSFHFVIVRITASLWVCEGAMISKLQEVSILFCILDIYLI